MVVLEPWTSSYMRDCKWLDLLTAVTLTKCSFNWV